MEKKLVLAELDYIFNLVKGNFDVAALARHLTAAGQWNKFVKDKAKSFGIKVPNDFNPEKTVKQLVRQKTNKFEDEQEQVEDWVMAYLFLPEALDKLDVDEDTGASYWKSRNITDVFESFNKKKDESPEKEHNFGGWVNSAAKGAISKYIREEDKRNEPFISENSEELAKTMQKVPQKDKAKHSPKEEGATLPFGLNPGDIDKIESIGDFRDNVRLKELTQNAKKYVNENAPKEVAKLFNLRLEDEFMPFKEIGEKLKKDKATISNYLKQLAGVLLDFAAKEDNADLTRLIEKMISKTKAIPKDKKAASVARLSYVVAKLESIFTEVPKKDASKIASITEYIHTLCNKIP